MARAAMASAKVTPTQFWQALGGSASLSPLEKWRVAERTPVLRADQVDELIQTFSDELLEWIKHYGDETAKALRASELGGNTDSLHDIAFWERRISEHGLPGDFWGFLNALADHLDVSAEKHVEVACQMLARYGDSDNPETQVRCAKTLFNKGWTLGERLDDPRGAVAI